MAEIQAFNKWTITGITVEDAGLQKYVSLNARYVPRSGARYYGRKFYKSKTFIVERLMNKLMIPGHKAKKHLRTSGPSTGKAQTAYGIVEKTFTIIEQKLKENPIKIFIKALENVAPREEIIAIEYGGARYPKAVECSPQRRVDIALRNISQGAFSKCFKTKVGIQNALAEEIMSAYKLSAKSNAISKKYELERQADASR